MIIFDLDGTLADCEHRRHFVDPIISGCNLFADGWFHINKNEEKTDKFRPDWKAFYEACDQDKPIKQTIEMFHTIHRAFIWNGYRPPSKPPIEIWSGRCESVRKKTEAWLFSKGFCTNIKIKMRPEGDNTPDDELKERWLDEVLAEGKKLDFEFAEGKKIDFVFDDRPKVVRMWRRRGIFVFNCCQHDEEF